MSINVKKYTKDQMAKMVEEAHADVQELKRVNAALTEQVSQLNGEAITRENVIANLKADADVLRNKLAYIKAALGRANACIATMNVERDQRTKDLSNARERANYAEAHPWRNLWTWMKKKAGCKA